MKEEQNIATSNVTQENSIDSSSVNTIKKETSSKVSYNSPKFFI